MIDQTCSLKAVLPTQIKRIRFHELNRNALLRFWTDVAKSPESLDAARQETSLVQSQRFDRGLIDCTGDQQPVVALEIRKSCSCLYV